MQKWVDEGGIDGHATTPEAILELHRRFYERLPPDLMVVEYPSTEERIPVIPGAIRDNDVEGGAPYCRQPRCGAAFFETLGRSLRKSGPDRKHPCRRLRASPIALGSPIASGVNLTFVSPMPQSRRANVKFKNATRKLSLLVVLEISTFGRGHAKMGAKCRNRTTSHGYRKTYISGGVHAVWR